MDVKSIFTYTCTLTLSLSLSLALSLSHTHTHTHTHTCIHTCRSSICTQHLRTHTHTHKHTHTHTHTHTYTQVIYLYKTFVFRKVKDPKFTAGLSTTITVRFALSLPLFPFASLFVSLHVLSYSLSLFRARALPLSRARSLSRVRSLSFARARSLSQSVGDSVGEGAGTDRWRPSIQGHRPVQVKDILVLTFFFLNFFLRILSVARNTRRHR